jgi:ABC-type nitrate/sulfonate/bicarbonate transport system substrate-binding protein
MFKKTHTSSRAGGRSKLRLGFVPLADSAPLIVAQELGLFRKYSLKVSLSRELGWATIRDKIIQGELEAAHALAGMPFAATLGLGSIRCDCLTALVLNQHGDAITLSNELWQRGIRDTTTLREEVEQSRGHRRYTFGVVFSSSCHNFILRAWLASAGIDPDRDVQIVVVPPPQMAANLKAGHLDGFCAGEPWNSVAVRSRAGWIAEISAELAPGHPEKVLMVKRQFAEERSEEHQALICALLDACKFCQAIENRDEIIGLLSRSEYVGTPVPTLRAAFGGEADFGNGRIRTVPNLNVFHGDSANEPSMEKAAWVLGHLLRVHKKLQVSPSAVQRQVFRFDIFQQATRSCSAAVGVPVTESNDLAQALAGATAKA